MFREAEGYREDRQSRISAACRRKDARGRHIEVVEAVDTAVQINNSSPWVGGHSCGPNLVIPVASLRADRIMPPVEGDMVLEMANSFGAQRPVEEVVGADHRVYVTREIAEIDDKVRGMGLVQIHAAIRVGDLLGMVAKRIPA
jgi:hypothetical protein